MYLLYLGIFPCIRRSDSIPIKCFHKLSCYLCRTCRWFHNQKSAWYGNGLRFPIHRQRLCLHTYIKFAIVHTVRMFEQFGQWTSRFDTIQYEQVEHYFHFSQMWSKLFRIRQPLMKCFRVRNAVMQNDLGSFQKSVCVLCYLPSFSRKIKASSTNVDRCIQRYSPSISKASRLSFRCACRPSLWIKYSHGAFERLQNSLFIFSYLPHPLTTKEN